MPASAMPNGVFGGAEEHDSIEISLITCTPGSQLWAQYGHTALRFHNLTTNVDLAVNYGVFSSNQPYFVLRFIFGLTDYRIYVEPFATFLSEYIADGRGVTEQMLDLTYADKLSIIRALEENILPENQVYRYNIFHDNCSTRARDLIVNHITNGTVQYPPAAGDSCTFRTMVHRFNKVTPWVQFGEDWLLGLPADYATNKAEQQFLPSNLQEDFDKGIYAGHPLVSSTRMIVTPKSVAMDSGRGVTPMDVIIIMFIITIAFEIYEYRRKNIIWGIDLFYMLLTGLPGIVLTLMIFSQHPTVSLNLLILFINPLPLFFAYQAVKHTKANRKYWWWTLWEILIVLGMIGGLFQTYPRGMIILALLLLTRPLLHHYIERTQQG